MKYHDAHDQMNAQTYRYLWHSSAKDYMGTAKRRKGRPSGKKVEAAFKEVYAHLPRTVVKSGKTGASKRKMMAAIAFSKARRNK